MTEPTPVPSAHSTRSERPASAGRALGWLAGLPILAILWAAATYAIETATSDALLGAALRIVRLEGTDMASGEPWLRLSVSGRDLIAEGDAPDEDQRKAVMLRLAALPGLRRIADEVEPIVEISPFVWQARLTRAGRIELDGYRPPEIAGSVLVAKVASAIGEPATIEDRTHPARRAPPDFARVTTFAAATLRWLKPGATVGLTDTLLSFEGEAASPEAHDAIRAALGAPPPGFALGRVEIAAPAVDHYRLAILRSADGATHLEGYVSAQPFQRTILDAAAEIAAGAPVTDALRLARGLPAEIDEAALTAFAMRLAGLICEGRVEVMDQTITATGLAIDAQAIGEIGALMREARPAGTREGTVTLEAKPVSPYRLQIRRDDGSLILSGHVPDQAARQQLLARVRALFFHERVVDRLRVADGAPVGLSAAVSAALAPLSTLATGSIEISDATLRLTGESLYSGSAERTRTGLPSAMPLGWTISVAIKPEREPLYDAATCTLRLGEANAQRALRFAPGSSELTPELHRALDAAAELARHCPTQKFEVAGYADPAGAKTEPPVLPEYTASIKTAEPARKAAEAKPARKDAAKPGTAAKSEPPKKGEEAKKAAKTEAAPAEAPREPVPDLADQRAIVVLDYLLQAGVPADRAAIVPRASAGADRVSLGLVGRS